MNHLKYLLVDLLSSFKIKAFRQHITIYIFSFTALDVFNSVFTYFVVYALSKDTATVSGLLSIAAFVSIPGTFGFMMLMNKFNMTPSGALRISYSCIFAVLAFLFFVYMSGINVPTVVFSAVFVVLGLARAGLYYIPWNIYSFIPDVDEMVTRQRREGIFAGVMVLMRKSTVALAIMIVGVVLEFSGFVKGMGSQPESALDAIIGLMVFATAILLAVSFWMTFKFKLTQHTHEVLIKEIDRRKQGGQACDCNTETRQVIKDLTGYAYDKVWVTKPTDNPLNGAAPAAIR